MHQGRRIKSLELAGADALDRRFNTAVMGEIVLHVTIENARLYSLEIP